MGWEATREVKWLDELDRSPPSSEAEQFDLWEDILVEGFCRAHEAIVASSQCAACQARDRLTIG
jgi:hypothetical protein